MPLYSLQRVQRIPIDLTEAWDFFSNPRNLAVITPPWLAFRVVSEPPPRIHPGLIVRYRIRPVTGLSLSWTTEITHAEPPRLFVDEQRFGPYRFWHHLHRFEPIEGGVEMTDLVHYRLFGGWFSSPLHAALVRPRLREIFDYRRSVLEGRFGPYPGRAVLHEERREV